MIKDKILRGKADEKRRREETWMEWKAGQSSEQVCGEQSGKERRDDRSVTDNPPKAGGVSGPNTSLGPRSWQSWVRVGTRSVLVRGREGCCFGRKVLARIFIETKSY